MHEIGGALRVRNSWASVYRYKEKHRFNGIFAPASVIKKLCILSSILRRNIFPRAFSPCVFEILRRSEHFLIDTSFKQSYHLGTTIGIRKFVNAGTGLKIRRSPENVARYWRFCSLR